MLVNLNNQKDELQKVIDIPDLPHTPLIIVDAEIPAPHIVYQLDSIGDKYNYKPVVYFIKGTESNALVDRTGKLIEESKEEHVSNLEDIVNSKQKD